MSPVKFSVEQAVRSEPENIRRPFKEMQNSVDCYQMYEIITHAVREGFNRLYLSIGQSRLRLDRSTTLYIYKAKNCKLLAVFTDAQKTKFIFKYYIKTLFNIDLFLTINY